MGDDESGQPVVTLIPWIIILILLVIVIVAVVMFDIPGLVREWIPGFEKPNVTVRWGEDVFLEHPEFINFYIAGREANIYLKYNPEINEAGEVFGWMWSKEINGDKRGFRASGNKDFILFKELSERNKNFINSLSGIGPEKGLELIVKRVLENDEGNWWFNSDLTVTIGDWIKVYSPKENKKELMDLEGLIIKFNQISRGIKINSESRENAVKKLNNPEKIIFLFDGVYYNYKNGWKWSDDMIDWRNKDDYYFLQLSSEKRKIIINIEGKNPEEGLKLLSEEVARSGKELVIGIEEWNKTYNSESEEIQNPEKLITKLNEVLI